MLSQPKRFALLVFLASARPRGFHSRDTLLGLFWPEADDTAARNALRQALHYLRRSLGEEALVSRSDRDIGVDPERIWCDAAAFDVAIQEKRYADALELYHGDFMPGFFLEDAPEVERWLDEERTARRRAAVDAAWQLSNREEKSGHLRAAILFARQAVSLTPVDEQAVRKLMSLLDKAGEPGAAIEAFEELERRLDVEYGITPSAETIELVSAIRSRRYQPQHRATVLPAQPVVAAATLAQPVQVVALPAPPAPVPPERQLATPIEVRPRRRLWPQLAAAAVLLFLMVSGAWYATRRPMPSPLVEASRALAVLPFDNLSADPENEYFSDGITDEILNALVQVQGLRVASRTSSFAFKNKDVDIREIGRLLGVNAVLEGTVRREGDRVRITAALVNVADGVNVWSKSYDRQIKDILTLQEEIAHEIADALALQFSEEDHAAHMRRATSDPEAYDLYLRANYLITFRSQERNQEAIQLFGEATARDPRFALAYAGLARAHIAAAEFVAPRQVLPRAKAAALRALQLDSTLYETRLALSEVRQVYDRDWLAAEYEIQRAIALHPNSAEAHAAYAFLLLDARRFEEARREREHAWRLRALQAPDSTLPAFRQERAISWATFAWYTGSLQEALRRAREAFEIDPSNVTARLLLCMLYVDLNRPADAVREAEHIARITNNATSYLVHIGRAYALAGRTEEARALLDTLHARSQTRYVGKDQIALLHYALGDTTAALDWLEHAVDDYHWWMPNSNYHPLWRGLHEHPRFRALMRKIGAP